MKILLDTNAYSELKRGHAAVAEAVRRSARVIFSTIVVGELSYGFRFGKQTSRNQAELEDLLSRPRVEVVPVDLETSDRFGRVATQLRKRGTPIPTNDIWIAAHAMQYGANLISFDAHFEHVDGLVWTLPG